VDLLDGEWHHLVAMVSPDLRIEDQEGNLYGDNVTVVWGRGTLQTAPTAMGPWTDAAATSPLTEPAGDTAKFYRRKLN
jgi:hypothetical protein